MSLAALLAVADPAELRARMRSLRVAARLVCRPRGRDLERGLHAAERDPGALPRVVEL